MNARQRREAAQFTAGGGTVQTYTVADRLRPAFARLRGRPDPGLRASRTVTGPASDLAWIAASPIKPLNRTTR